MCLCTEVFGTTRRSKLRVGPGTHDISGPGLRTGCYRLPHMGSCKYVDVDMTGVIRYVDMTTMLGVLACDVDVVGDMHVDMILSRITLSHFIARRPMARMSHATASWDELSSLCLNGRPRSEGRMYGHLLITYIPHFRIHGLIPSSRSCSMAQTMQSSQSTLPRLSRIISSLLELGIYNVLTTNGVQRSRRIRKGHLLKAPT